MNLLKVVHCSIFFLRQTSAFYFRPQLKRAQKEEEEEEHNHREYKVRPSNNCEQKPLSGRAFTTEHNFYVIGNPEFCMNSNRRMRHENVGLMEEVLKNLKAIGFKPVDK